MSESVSPTWKPIAAGILSIMAGFFWIIGELFISLVLGGLSIILDVGILPAFLLWLIGAAIAVPGILAIVGGIFSLRRRQWALALIGSVCAIPSGLGIAATILLALSRREFT